MSDITLTERVCDECTQSAQHRHGTIGGVSFPGWVKVSVNRSSMIGAMVERDFCSTQCAIEYLQRGDIDTMAEGLGPC